MKLIGDILYNLRIIIACKVFPKGKAIRCEDHEWVKVIRSANPALKPGTWICDKCDVLMDHVRLLR